MHSPECDLYMPSNGRACIIKYIFVHAYVLAGSDASTGSGTLYVCMVLINS